MSDQESKQEAAGEKPEDALKNLKAEMARKHDNTNKELESIKNMLGSIAQSVQPKQQKQVESEEPDPILDPKGYKEYLKREVMQETNNLMQNNNQRQGQLAALVQSYPELQDANSELAKRAVDVYSRLSQEEKMSPNAYKFAVQDAASELGVLSMSKRQQKQNESQDEDFTMNSGSYSGNKKPSKGQKADKLDDATLAFAEAIGKDINDPKYIESLKKYANRKNWNKGS
jgi:hypothetical protein